MVAVQFLVLLNNLRKFRIEKKNSVFSEAQKIFDKAQISNLGVGELSFPELQWRAAIKSFE
jgi:hypothetical protein